MKDCKVLSGISLADLYIQQTQLWAKRSSKILLCVAVFFVFFSLCVYNGEKGQSVYECIQGKPFAGIPQLLYSKEEYCAEYTFKDISTKQIVRAILTTIFVSNSQHVIDE